MAENPADIPRQKRKYTKKSKMLLRSNNDYIDHGYWPKAYAESKERMDKILAKYGAKGVSHEPARFTDAEKDALKRQGINRQIKIVPVPDEPVTRIPLKSDTL